MNNIVTDSNKLLLFFLSVVKQSNFKQNSGAHINEATDRWRKLTLLFGFLVIIVQTWT